MAKTILNVSSLILYRSQSLYIAIFFFKQFNQPGIGLYCTFFRERDTVHDNIFITINTCNLFFFVI